MALPTHTVKILLEYWLNQRILLIMEAILPFNGRRAAIMLPFVKSIIHGPIRGRQAGFDCDNGARALCE